MPQLWIVADPNGAGKKTLALARLTERIIVVNPDAIANSLPRIDGKRDERLAGTRAIECETGCSRSARISQSRRRSP